MGLPQIDIEFKGRAVSAIKRSALGIVALLLRDTTLVGSNTITTIKSVEDLNTAEWTAENYDYINKTLLGTPSKVLVLKLGTDEEVNGALKKLANVKFNFLAMPGATAEENQTIVTWIKGKRDNDKKTYKYVGANIVADHEGVINFTTTGIKVGDKSYTTQQYTSRIAGVLAGLPFTQSATYFVLAEVTEIEEHETPDEDIDNGELILVNDGESIKIGRGVNSLTTTTVTKTEDFKKIKIVDVMDMIKDDIRDVFNNEYIGKCNNIYDNQVLFISSINSYFSTLSAIGTEILDNNYDNRAEVNVNVQRNAWEGIGTDTSEWDDNRVKEMSFKSNVYLGAKIKIVDAMEDLDFLIEI